MKEKIKEIFKSYLPGFILGIISASIITVYAETFFPSNQTTYDNTNTELKSENVQDAIDELYGVCFPKSAGDSILDNTDIVTSGDGLYEDEYEEGRYFYKGANPNNYITFNDEKAGWRIISINDNKTIKIIKISSIGNMAWDTSNNNNWDRPATLNTYLNENYYNSLTNIAQNQIVEANYSIGTQPNKSVDLQTQINEENNKKWNGKVALPTITEYIRANNNKKSCGTEKLSFNNWSTCKNTNWMYIANVEYWWTLTNNNAFSQLPTVTACYSGYIIGTEPRDSQNAGGKIEVRPVVTLSSDIKITGGDGSQSNPYTIE